MTETKQKTEAEQTAPAVQEAPAKKRRRKPKHLKRWIILGIVVLLTGGFVIRTIYAGRKMMEAITAYTEEPVAERTIIHSLTGSATLKPANSYTLTTLIEGEVLSADFEEGDIVEKDSVLYEVDSSDVANNIERAELSLSQARRSYNSTADLRYIKADTAGTVYSLSVGVGDSVSAGQVVGTVRDSGTMTLELPFPADDALNFYAGQPAEVTLDGSFETLWGTVKSVSGSDIVGTGNMITRNVTISVDNPGGLSVSQAAAANVGGVGCAVNGSFKCNSESALVAMSSGTVSAINVAEGSWVSKDQAVVTLGGRSINDSIQNAADSLRNAELAMENTQEQLDNYTITSPIGGTVVNKEYKTGDTIEAGKQLCTIYDLSYLEMVLSIDELDIASIKVGQKVKITADAVPNAEFDGTVTKVSVAGTTQGGITSYPVTVRIDDTGGLLPGMNVDAEIVVSRAENALSVIGTAISRGAGGASVVLVTADSPSAVNAIERDAPEGYVYVEVETGAGDGDYFEITGGLQLGDTIAYIPPQTSNIFGMFMAMSEGMSAAEGGGPG
ncbi:MAG: HlyD family efflux transporter periplasmic adaptor subunit [Butyricicoccus sp.]|nr:HlyD family efflux transporter periplasmic adaptor subunit [Butyricicoccus sp.]